MFGLLSVRFRLNLGVLQALLSGLESRVLSGIEVWIVPFQGLRLLSVRFRLILAKLSFLRSELVRGSLTDPVIL